MLEIQTNTKEHQNHLIQIEAILNEVRLRPDGQALLSATEQLQQVYEEVGELVDRKLKADWDRIIGFAKGRFDREGLLQNNKLGLHGVLNLTKGARLSRFAAESFDRCIRNNHYDFKEAFSRVANALDHMYRTTRPGGVRPTTGIR